MLSLLFINLLLLLALPALGIFLIVLLLVNYSVDFLEILDSGKIEVVDTCLKQVSIAQILYCGDDCPRLSDASFAKYVQDKVLRRGIGFPEFS